MRKIQVRKIKSQLLATIEEWNTQTEVVTFIKVRDVYQSK